MTEFVVVGGGDQARVVIATLRKYASYHVFGYTDAKDRGAVFGVPYLGTDAVLVSSGRSANLLLPENAMAALGVGQLGLGTTREALWRRLEPSGLSFPRLVSPDAIVHDTVTGGEASVILDGAVLQCGVALGRGVIVNTRSAVDHDCTLGDWVHIAPGVTLCGGVTVGTYSLIGAGATVIEGRRIAACCVVGAGATVIQDLTEPGVYVGTPARRIH
ncbi:MAG: hexapeptide transferase [Acidobacteriaceae bacterium]|jgi:sugar O-acyltransferase (sialic acid O-acetyltransferase NeuD family)|nr:hexapeptide transferase [Acidobacteriaceae bacterium]